MQLPSLRNIDAFPVEHEGQTLICLRDPSGTIEEPVIISPLAFFIATQLNGFTTAPDILKACEQHVGPGMLTEEAIFEFVSHLDDKGFLLTETFDRIRAEVHRKFRDGPSRPAYLAGKSYPEDPETLREFLDDMFVGNGIQGTSVGANTAETFALKGLIVPHIDFHRGSHSYAHGYLEMSKHGKPDTVFVFGVAHAAEPVPFILTRKDFETPLGTVKTDQEMVDALVSACNWDPFEHELTHRTEHSVEFQAVMLAHLYGSDVKIVPILCSMFSVDENMSDPDSLPDVQAFLDACRQCVSDPNRRVSVIAGADLAHVGKRFGDAFDIDDDVIRRVAERDEEDMAFVHGLDAGRFYGSVMRDRNERKVCGLNCIYAALKSLEGSVQSTEPLHYGYAHDPAGGIVSFASVALR